MKSILIGWLAVVLFSGPSTIFEGKVIDVIDGNTIEVLTPDNEKVKVLLKVVDCPELSQDYGVEARRFSEKLIYKRKVVVELKGKDRWGNKLAVVKLKNGKVLHEELLKAGLAWINTDEMPTLGQIEANAKANKSGLWIQDNPTPPWVYRRNQSMLQPKTSQ